MYREEELEAAIEHDLTQCYRCGDSDIIDEFIEQMGVEEME